MMTIKCIGNCCAAVLRKGMAVHRLGWDHDTGLKVFFMLLILLSSSMAHADDAVEIDGIWYTLNTQEKTADVTESSSSKYTGNIVIPETVSYNNSKYKVTSIGESAFSNCIGLTSVTIPNNVTSIGSFAFYGCSGLTSVTIPNSVKSIGVAAFSGCGGLTSVTIPNSVTSIKISAFEGCSGLTSITIPSSVTSIESSAFKDCSGLTSVTIPNSVTSIGSHAFEGCSGLTSVDIPDSVTSIGFLAFEGCSGLTSVTIPNSVTSIESSTFDGCSSLTSVTIPNSVTSIGGGAFSGCSGLTSVTIPNSVTSIGISAFEGCSGLTSITIPSSVTSIGKCAFKDCSGLTSIISQIKEPFWINSYVFSESTYTDAVLTVPVGTKPKYEATGGWSRFKNIVEEGGGTTYKDGDTFKVNTTEGIEMTFKVISVSNKICQVGDGSNSAISTDVEGPVTIPESVNGFKVVTIGNKAFFGCSNLTSVTIPDSVTSIGVNAFAGCSGLTSVTIPNNVTSIENYTFLECFGLISVTIPNSVTSIGVNAFAGCSGLTSVTIPNSVKSIGVAAFSGCSGLTSVTIPNSVTSIETSAFEGCSGLTSVTIPNSVTSIETSAFEGCSGLTSVTIPSSVTSIESSAFKDCSGLTSIISQIKEPFWINSYVFSESTYTDAVLTVPVGTKPKYEATGGWSRFKNIVEEGGGTTYKDGDTFKVNTTEGIEMTFKVISVSNKTCQVGDGSNSAISTAAEGPVTIPDSVNGFNVVTIGNQAFSDCSSLTSVTIPNSVTSIGNGAFSGCSGLTSVTIPNSVKSIEIYTFFGCSGLTSVTIPNSVTSIGVAAFSGCSGLTSVTIPNSVMSIGNGAFYQCSGLTSVTIPNSVTIINDYTFDSCSGLTSVSIPNSVTSIGKYAFCGCGGLISITIPSSVTSIGESAFADCCRLTSVISQIKEPFWINSYVFCYSTYTYAVLTVPAGTKPKYKVTSGWKDFKNIVEEGGQKLQLSASPEGGQVEKGTTVTLTATSDGSVVSGCDIYYTLDGTTPTKSSTKYTSSGITLNSDCTLKAVAYKDGYETSDVLTVTYTLKETPKPKLTLSASPSGGKVAAWTKVTLIAKANGNTVSDCDIYYTTDGSTPTKDSTPYTSSGITIYPACILKAIAYKSGYETSEVLSTNYAIELFLYASPSGGAIEKGTKVELFARDADDNDLPADIYYTLNGSTPTKNSTPYTSSGITINNNCTLKAIAYNLDIASSDVLTATYTIEETPKPKLTLSASPRSGQVSAGTTVTLTATSDGNVVSGCDIYYTLDGTKPTNGSTKYTSSGITLNSDCTLKAVAMKDGYEDSEPLTAVYAIKNSNASGDGSLENPFNAVAAINKAKELAVGEVSSQDYYVKGKISSIKYYYSAQYGTAAFNISDDGLDKDQFYVYGSYYLENKPWVDGNPQIEIGDDVILYGKMMNYNGTLEMADRLNYVYSHNGRIKLAPKLILSASPEGGQVEKGTTVTLKVEADGEIVSGCDIYYTLDGTTPTKSSTKYTSSGITLNSDCTLKAIAMKDGYEDSELLTAVYAIKNSNASGDGSLENPFNAVAAINKAKELAVGEVSSQNYYVKGKISSIKYYYSAQYGTAAFNISDDGLDKDQFCIYGSYYLENKPWVDGNPQIEIGDDVILYGKMMNYNGTLEMADRLNYVYSHNGRIKLAPKLILSASPEGGQVEKGTTVTLKVEADGAIVSDCDIYYTLDGAKPTNGSTKYTSTGITITETCTMQAIAKKDGYEDGELEARYEVVETPDPGKDVTWTDPETAVAYTLSTSGTTATVSGVDGNKAQGDVVIPSKITYDGKTYQVTAIDKGVFKSAGNVRSITVPESITEVGKEAFASEGLLALVWNPRQVMQADVLLNEGSGRSKNFLLYCYKDMAPQGVGHVVEMDGSGNNRARNAIVLAEGANFYCPLAFTANVSYTHYFSMHTGLTACEGWESIALPFDVERVKHSDGRVLRPFGVQRSGSERPFWLYEMKQGGFVKATAIKANTPYIISMPNNEAYLDDYNVEGEVTFEAENATIRTTAQLNSITIQGKGTFQPTFTELRANSTTACLNSSNAQHTATGGEAPGSHFMTNLRAAVPFEAVFDNVPAGVRRIAVSLGGDDTDDIRELSVLRDEEPERIYNLNGQRIESMKHRGLYIVSSAKGRRQGEKARKYVKCR